MKTFRAVIAGASVGALVGAALAAALAVWTVCAVFAIVAVGALVVRETWTELHWR